MFKEEKNKNITDWLWGFKVIEEAADCFKLNYQLFHITTMNTKKRDSIFEARRRAIIVEGEFCK